MEVEGVDGGIIGFVGLTESYGVGGEAAESGGDEVGEEASVGVGGGAAAVEHDDVDGVVGAGVVVVHPVTVDDEEGFGVWEVLVGHGGWLVGKNKMGEGQVSNLPLRKVYTARPFVLRQAQDDLRVSGFSPSRG